MAGARSFSSSLSSLPALLVFTFIYHSGSPTFSTAGGAGVVAKQFQQMHFPNITKLNPSREGRIYTLNK